MAMKATARSLQDRVTLSMREVVNPDSPADYGTTIGEWVDQFTLWAQFMHLRGGEAVMAGRLEGKHTQVVRVRASTQSRTITTDWRLTDLRSGDVFNVRDVTETTDRRWVDILAESGVA